MADNNNIFKPGDVEITKIWLYSDDGNREYNLMQQVVSIDIYESLLSPIIYADGWLREYRKLFKELWEAGVNVKCECIFLTHNIHQHERNSDEV